MTLKISAIVVGRNEALKLSNCLKSLSFCDEILYGDLNSGDNSIEIASSYGCKIFKYEKFGPAGEYTQSDLIKLVNNEWVVVMDPDEVIDSVLIKEIQQTIVLLQSNKEIGEIYVPWQFYFGKRKLHGTVWGHKKFKGIIINKNRFEILPITHYGRRLKPGYKSYYLKREINNVLHHYWMDDFSSFIAKHKRYLKDEGLDRYNLGQRISIIGIIYNIFYQFLYCYVKARGFRDGFIGLFLSFFWVWYCTSANISLYTVIKKNK